MKRITRFSLFIVFIIVFHGNKAYCIDLTFEGIIGGVNSKFELIKTMSTNVVRTSFKGNTTVKESWSYYFKKPDKLKVEYKEPHERLLVLNGNSFIEYIPKIKKARVIDLSDYDAKEKASFYQQVFARVSLLGLRLGNMKKGRVSIKKVRFDEFDAFFIDSKKPDYQLWIDIKTNALLRHVVYNGNGEVMMSTQGADFKMFKGNILLPQKVKAVLPDLEKKGEMITSDMSLNNLRVNEGISDTVFEFELPKDVEIIK